MAKQKVKATLVSCWGNPTAALETLNQISEVNDQYFIRHALSTVCCLLTPLGFNCSMSFWHNLDYHIIFSYCNITIGKEQFTFLGNERNGDDIEAYCGRIADFISRHTEKDGLFHYAYERRALA